MILMADNSYWNLNAKRHVHEPNCKVPSKLLHVPEFAPCVRWLTGSSSLVHPNTLEIIGRRTHPRHWHTSKIMQTSAPSKIIHFHARLLAKVQSEMRSQCMTWCCSRAATLQRRLDRHAAAYDLPAFWFVSWEHNSGMPFKLGGLQFRFQSHWCNIWTILLKGREIVQTILP